MVAAINPRKQDTMTSIKTLKTLCEQINKASGQPLEPYTQTDGRFKANVGNYHLSQAYGGVCLNQMVNESGGCSAPLGSYHRPKKQLESEMRAFLSGIEAR